MIQKKREANTYMCLSASNLRMFCRLSTLVVTAGLETIVFPTIVHVTAVFESVVTTVYLVLAIECARLREWERERKCVFVCEREEGGEYTRQQ